MRLVITPMAFLLVQLLVVSLVSSASAASDFPFIIYLSSLV